MNHTMIPVFYACDNDFVKYAVISIKSLIENTADSRQYKIHILNTDISEEWKSKVLRLSSHNVEISFENVSDYLNVVGAKLPIRDYYSKTTYFRLFIAEMFPEYQKAVYLDSDTIVLGDPAELFDLDIADNYVGAVQEQVMIQTDVFGTYVEQVVGIERNRYFNAGVLLLNCEQLRENCVLDQFIDLLHAYNFVVTQDEDYLNVICKDHVMWLGSEWNTEVFGEIPCREEDIKLLHYIMVSKPWHYDDCRFSAYFWKYAKMTEVYEDVYTEMRKYSKKDREKDEESVRNLEQMALKEIAREDNYHRSMEACMEKAKDRLEVLSKIAQYEREGRFDVDVEEDPPTKELLPDQIDYLRKKTSSKVKSKFAYTLARKYVNTLIADKKMIVKEIKGIENFRNLQSGAVITCNHFNAFDSFAIQLTYEASGQKNRKFYRVIREGNYTNFPGFYGLLMRNCNTFPLSSNIRTMEKFMKSMDTVLRKGHFMLVYPEQSMWWNYRKPKPLKKGAFTFAVRNNVPVLPCFITMEDSDILGEDGFYIQEYTVHVGKPIYPNPDRSRGENIEFMRQKNFDIWKEIYEKTYHTALTYTCESIAK